MTITEALAKLKTIEKRLAKKAAYVNNYVVRQKQMAEPDDFVERGGMRTVIQEELQSFSDLVQQRENIRLAIAAANAATPLTVQGETKSIAAWLVWRRECAPVLAELYSDLARTVRREEENARRHGAMAVDNESAAGSPLDIIFNLDRPVLQAKRDALEEILGDLDGQLSMKNATVTIEG